MLRIDLNSKNDKNFEILENKKITFEVDIDWGYDICLFKRGDKLFVYTIAKNSMLLLYLEDPKENNFRKIDLKIEKKLVKMKAQVFGPFDIGEEHTFISFTCQSECLIGFVLDYKKGEILKKIELRND